MDLLATVRKEGSRGGTGDFKWSDVQSSSHREHYLGHSLMAPVGRWQKNKDLNWYAHKSAPIDDDEDPVQRAARERKEELRRVKDAEEDALARALGLPVPDRNNPNMDNVASGREFDKVLKDAVGDNLHESDRGVGFGSGGPTASGRQITRERIEGNAEAQDREMGYALNEYRRRHGDQSSSRSRVHHRSRSRSREHQRRHRRDRSPGRSQAQKLDRHLSRRVSRERERHRKRTPSGLSRSRSRSKSPDNRHRHRHRRHDRSRSPYKRSRDDRSRRERD